MDGICALYDALAALLTYPDAGYAERVDRCRQALQDRFPEAASLLDRFAERTGVGCVKRSADAPTEPPCVGATLDAPYADLEELYTQTFDLNPVCSLEVGWHLFGENYSRGEFLVLMRQELRKHGLPESTELPDHLTHVLPAVARMEAQQATRFASTYILPALEKMQAGLAGKDSPYQDVLEAIRDVLISAHGCRSEPSPTMGRGRRSLQIVGEGVAGDTP